MEFLTRYFCRMHFCIHTPPFLLRATASQIARDVDGAGNYLMLTHKQVAQLHPRSCYSVAGRMPEWVLFHKFSIASNNYIRTASEIAPEL